MTRSVALLLVCVLLLAIASGAQAAPPHRTGQSPAEVAEYWTEDRMKGAIPRERARGAEPRAGKPSKGGATWTSMAVPLPYAGSDLTNGKVFFTENGVNYVCSGTSVSTSTGSLVWTAGHCVNEGGGAGRYVTNFMFAPGWVDGSAPYGRWSGTTLVTTDRWRTAGDFDYDVGAARVVPAAGAPPSGTLSNVAPPRPMTFNYPVVLGGTAVDAYGYPAAGKFNGQRLWRCSSPVTRRDGSNTDAPMGIGCDMTGGSSGGGWIMGGAVGSVNSYGYNGLKNVMFGPYHGTAAQALYNGIS